MNLTKKQAQMLEYIENFISQTGYSPTYREIQTGMGYGSVATVAKHIDNLVALGKLAKSTGGEARSIILLNQNDENLSQEQKTTVEFLKKKRDFYLKNGEALKAQQIEATISII